MSEPQPVLTHIPETRDAVGARILAVDVESSPMLLWGYGLRNQFFGTHQIERHSEIVGWASQWTDASQRSCQWYRADETGNWEKLWDQLDEATHVLHFNGQRFDIPFINTEIKRLGIRGGRPPSPYEQIDLYKQSRRNFRLASYKLEYVSTFLCKLEGKIDESALQLWLEIWRARLAGDEKTEAKAWARMERYCKRDVTIMPKMLDDLRPWLKNLNLNLYEDDVHELRCPNCSGFDLRRRGFAYTATGRRQRWSCNTCGSWTASARGGEHTRVRKES